MPSPNDIWTAFDYIRTEGKHFAYGHSLPSDPDRTKAERELTSQLRDLFSASSHCHSFFSPEHGTPRTIVDFSARIVERLKAKSVLDPTCGYGILLAAGSQAAKAEVIHGVDVNDTAASVASAVLGSDARVIHGDFFSCVDGLLDQYDLIIADPPLNAQFRTEQESKSETTLKSLDLASNLMIWASSRLSDAGHALFVVAPSFFHATKRRQVQRLISANGCRIAAAIYVPGGTRQNTSIPTYLVLLERGDQQDVFIGSFSSDPASQGYLLANLVRRKPRGDASLGRLCQLEEFNGFERFVAKENLMRLVREFGWFRHDAASVFPESELLRTRSHSNELEIGANSLFLKLVGKGIASTQADDLGQNPSEVLHLKVNTNIADPPFLAHWFNESRIGRLSLESLRDASTVPRIRAKDLLTSDVCLPSILEQRLLIEGSAYLRKIRADADELESALFSRSEAVEDVVQRIRRINQEDRYEDWIETLPFPLASILWRHHASQDSYRHRYEVLLHFFEATAAFIATIHLSAFMSDVSLWEEVRKSLRDKLFEQHLSLERATFGAWKLTAEKLASECSAILKQAERSSEKKEVWQRIYGTLDRRIVEMVSAPRLLGILQQANKIRNDWQGHSGAISEDTAKVVHS